MSKQQGTAASDAAAFASNIASSVAIVYINKVLLDKRHGYGFVFATFLCAIHNLVSGGAVRLWEASGLSERVVIPVKDIVVFCVVASASVASLNLSLLVNSVGFYQIAKLMNIPFVCIVEGIMYKRSYSIPVLLSITLTVVGVGIVTVSDISVNIVGLVIAGISVVCSGMQQILCGSQQRQLGVTAMQLLSNAGPIQGMMLLAVGPFLDKWVSNEWVWNYSTSTGGWFCFTASCAMAIFVNVSQFLCLGRFSALTFQVLGHLKTITVLTMSYLYFNDVMNARKATGMALAVLGMVLYGYFTSKPQPVSKQTAEQALEKLPLLNDAKEGTTSTRQDPAHKA